MSYDSYTDPQSESLLRAGQERFRSARPARRTLITEAAAAALFLAVAGSLAVWAPSGRSLSGLTLLAVAVVFLAARRVEFPVGSAHTWPAQLVVIPMFFVLPMRLVPLIGAALMLVDLAPGLIAPAPSHARAARILTLLGDNLYLLGPALVLILFHAQHFSWAQWPVYLLAFTAQVAIDLAAGLTRTWFADRILPSAQAQMVWLYVTDAALSCAGLQFAAVTVHRPGLILLELPVIGLLSLFARERRQRMDSTLELSSAYRGTALLLGDVVEGDDEYTGVHSKAVVDLSIAIADRLGLDAATRQRVEFGALLHDVGKIRVPKEILHKAGPLDPGQWAVMRMHTIYGEEMLAQVGGTLINVGRIVRASHERWDGGGYPDGLAGEQIPVEARIITACDAFHAMTSTRPYRPAMDLAEATAELRRCAGSHFDPAVVTALLGLVETAPRAASARRRADEPAAASAVAVS